MASRRALRWRRLVMRWRADRRARRKSRASDLRHCARARALSPQRACRAVRGANCMVVGIGPGLDGWRSPEVSAMVTASTDLVGYSLYLDLLGPLAAGKHPARFRSRQGRSPGASRHGTSPGEGKFVALVCSGDAGIYAMATLVFELLDKADGADGLTDGSAADRDRRCRRASRRCRRRRRGPARRSGMISARSRCRTC
jgi:hypothetical protein